MLTTFQNFNLADSFQVHAALYAHRIQRPNEVFSSSEKLPEGTQGFDVSGSVE